MRPGWRAVRPEDNDCVIGTLACRCTATAVCVAGLTCSSAHLCVAGGPAAGAGGAGGMAEMAAVTPFGSGLFRRDAAPPPPLQGEVDAGGAGQAPIGGDDGGAPATGPTWTVFVYGHGDHNLSPALAVDLGEMNRAKLSANVRVVLLADWDASRIARGNERYPTGAFWHRIRGSGQPSEILGTASELDFDNANVMASAIRTVFAKYPSDRYGLVLWDHGGGWRDGFGSDTQDGQRKQPTGMRVSTVAAAVRAGLDAAGLGGSRRLDFLAFDTCLLGTTEVATEFKDLAKVYIANAELDFGDGLDYEGALTWLAANPGATAQEFAVAEAKAWDAQHRSASISDQLFRSHVALDTQKFEVLTAELGNLVTQARSHGSVLARALFESMPSYYKSGDDEREERHPPTRDLGLILERIKAAGVPAMSGAATRVLEAAAAAKVAGAAGDLRQSQLGVGIFGGPVVGIADPLFSLYPMLVGPWERATGWGQLLASTKAAAPRTQPVIQGMAVVPEAPTQADPPRVEFEIAGSDAAAASLLFLELDPGNQDRIFIHGNIGTSFVGAGALAAKWFGRTTMINASASMPVTLLPWQFAVRGTTLSTALRKVPGLLQSRERDGRGQPDRRRRGRGVGGGVSRPARAGGRHLAGDRRGAGPQHDLRADHLRLQLDPRDLRVDSGEVRGAHSQQRHDHAERGGHATRDLRDHARSGRSVGQQVPRDVRVQSEDRGRPVGAASATGVMMNARYRVALFVAAIVSCGFWLWRARQKDRPAALGPGNAVAVEVVPAAVDASPAGARAVGQPGQATQPEQAAPQEVVHPGAAGGPGRGPGPRRGAPGRSAGGRTPGRRPQQGRAGPAVRPGPRGIAAPGGAGPAVRAKKRGASTQALISFMQREFPPDPELRVMTVRWIKGLPAGSAAKDATPPFRLQTGGRRPQGAIEAVPARPVPRPQP